MMCAYFLKFRFNLERRAKCSPDGGSSLPFFSQRSGPVDPKRITFQNAQRIVSEISVTLVWNIYQSSRIMLLCSHLTKEIGALRRTGWVGTSTPQGAEIRPPNNSEISGFRSVEGDLVGDDIKVL